MIEKHKERNYGLDLLRIISMMGIIGLHVINNGGILKSESIYNSNYYSTLLLLIICYMSVDIFGLLSGFLLVNKEKNKSKRIIELLGITAFYCIVLTIIFYAFNINGFKNSGIVSIISSFFPPITGNYWYITSYTFLFFMIPYLNEFINNVEKEKLKKFLIIVFIFLSVLTNIFFLRDFFVIKNGYSPFWLIYCYMIGGYIKKYEKDFNKKYTLRLVLMILLAFLFNIIIRITTNYFLGKIVIENWFINYISPFILAASIYMLLIFKKININNKLIKKIITYLSVSSFSVYIIHSHKTIYYFILKNMFISFSKFNFIITPILIIITIIGIYISCCLIDEIRKIIFKYIKIEKIINKLGNKLDELINN